MLVRRLAMDDNPSDIDWERLDSFITGRGTPQELDAIRHWIDADPELGVIVDAMRTVGQMARAQQPMWDERSAWAAMQGHMRQEGVRPLRVLRNSGEHSPSRAVVTRAWRPARSTAAVAAAAVLIFAAGVSAVVAKRWGAAPPAVASLTPPREVVTKRGERATLDLADGSHVVLGPESRLTIPSYFNEAGNARSRDLMLSGEAYFTVRHDSARPFRVATATAVMEDIGTSFVITAYSEAGATRLVVEEGSVALRRPAPANDAALAPGGAPLLEATRGDLARLDRSGTLTLVRGVDVDSYVAWTRGTIVFDGTRLSEAIPQLERWYDLDISVNDATLRARTLTGSFANTSAEIMLEQLSLALDVQVRRTGSKVSLSRFRTIERSPQ